MALAFITGLLHQGKEKHGVELRLWEVKGNYFGVLYVLFVQGSRGMGRAVD